ncbi:MAG: hypothetical protein AAGD92_09330 [Pseudomonadota bacterium]
MKYLVPAGAASFLVLSACVTDAPTSPDTEDPFIRVGLSGGARINIDTTEDRSDPTQQCIKASGTNVDVNIIWSDPGGMRNASFAVFPGVIDSSSVAVGPDAPDVTWRVENSPSGRGSIIIGFTPPGPGEVRTGATADFTMRVDPTGSAITADARDTSGNQVVFDQFDIRQQDDAITCING